METPSIQEPQQTNSNEFQQLAKERLDTRLESLSSHQKEWIEEKSIIFTGLLTTLYERNGDSYPELQASISELVKTLDSQVNIGSYHEPLSPNTASKITNHITTLTNSIKHSQGHHIV